MLGFVYWEEDCGRMRAVREQMLGLHVLRVGVRPGGRWEGRRLKRAAGLLRAHGVQRVLSTHGFDRWEALGQWGLKPVDPLPLYRSMASALVLAALERSGSRPEQATVTLRGTAARGDLARTAQKLCPRVRRLVIDAPVGGRELAGRLYWEFGAGVAVGRGERTDLCVCFDGPARAGELGLGAGELCLQGLEVQAPGPVIPAFLEPIPVLTALWQAGIVTEKDLQIVF